MCHAALARPAEERAAYLAEACAGDEAFRALENAVEDALSTAHFP